jgi:hypothetical protein
MNQTALEEEEAMNGQTDNRAALQDEVLALNQRSVRRQEDELRQGDQVIGWLGFPPGTRSTALGEASRPAITLTARSGRVVVAGPDAVATIATVERERGVPR